MANIAQFPAELNISRIVKGEAFVFQTIHDGNITADTFAATIKNGSSTITLTLGISYSAITLKTTITYTLSAANSALLAASGVTWKMVQTSGGIARTILFGTVDAIAL
jgi:hypothetical protein